MVDSGESGEVATEISPFCGREREGGEGEEEQEQEQSPCSIFFLLPVLDTLKRAFVSSVGKV